MVSYLINLDREAARLDHMRREFNCVGLSFTRIPAVDGASLSSETIAPFQNHLDRDRGKYTLGHIGCFLSHVAAWQKIADGSEDFAAIFEDDVHLSSLIPFFLDNFHWVPSDADIVRLETMCNGMRLDKPIAEYHGITVKRVYAHAWGTGGYVIRKDVARCLINLPTRYHTPIDYFLFYSKTSAVARTLRVYQLDPALCIQDSLHPNTIGFESTTKNAQKRSGRRALTILRPVARMILRRKSVPFVA
jgi:glycosyl transferase family 25